MTMTIVVVHCGSTCGCDGPPDTSFDIQSINIENRLYVQLSDEYWRPTDTNTIDPNETVNALNYLIELRAVVDPPHNVVNRKLTIFDFIFGKSAMACSLLPPHIDEIIGQLTITSDSDFSTLYPAGSSLNEIFVIQYTSAFGDYASGQNVDEFVDLNPHGALKTQIVLTEAPMLAKEHIFKIEYMHHDGEYFEAYTERVTFH